MIHIKALNLTVGSFALRDVSLQIEQGEYFVLLGSSGSGKTLLLESVCGLHRIDSGRVIIDGVDVTNQEPRWRRVGYLPQDYTLFPHLPVRYNVGFGLSNPLSVALGTASSSIQKWLDMVGVTPLRDRLPGQLSGGEQQRVALARALAAEPRLLLLDEPVSALDERTRNRLCRELKQLQQKTRTTTIHVCHNFTEMMAVADRVGVIDQGRIVQVGSPGEVLERPDSPSIARFVQAENLFSGVVSDAGDWLRITCEGNIDFFAPRNLALPREVQFMIRPENIILSATPQPMPEGMAQFEGVVQDIIDRGPLVELTIQCTGTLRIRVSLGKRDYRANNLQIAGHVHVAVHAKHVHVWPETIVR